MADRSGCTSNPRSCRDASDGAERPRPRVVAIVGPTGTGKTELACAVARRCGGEVISADSMQVYRGMDIGTAKPSAALRTEIAHHAIDLVRPDEPMSAGIWLDHARRAAFALAARGRPVILCGGTGLYARAFARGLVRGIASSPALRAELESRDTADLRAELARVDPPSAARIPARDRVRVVRALEAARLAGRPLSAQHAEHGFRDEPFEVRWLALDLERDALRARLRARTERMLRDGLVDEVRALHAAGFGPGLRPLRSIGYREIGELLRGELSLEGATDAIAVATQRFAKRQRTWFRAEPGLVWLDASRVPEAIDSALRALDHPQGMVL